MEIVVQLPEIGDVHVLIGEENVHIVDSYRVKENVEKEYIIRQVRKVDPEVWEDRTDESLISEWKAHNALYKRGLWVSHTKDVDLESHQDLFHKIAWFFVNLIFKE